MPKSRLKQTSSLQSHCSKRCERNEARIPERKKIEKSDKLLNTNRNRKEKGYQKISSTHRLGRIFSYGFPLPNLPFSKKKKKNPIVIKLSSISLPTDVFFFLNVIDFFCGLLLHWIFSGKRREQRGFVLHLMTFDSFLLQCYLSSHIPYGDEFCTLQFTLGLGTLGIQHSQ